jgi:hypothetical protein
MQSEIHQSISVLLGDPNVASQCRAWKPFDERVVRYLSDFSRKILVDPETRQFPDLVSLAYWCRTASITRLAARYSGDEFLIGRGLAFHIPPSNVPLNFAYSLFCGLLSGNSNIVRLSSTESVEVDLLIDVMTHFASTGTHSEVCERLCLLRYDHNDTVTRHFSMISAARIIWGGNETVRRIRAVESAPRCVDIAFADRLSVSLMNASSVLSSSGAELVDLVEKFIIDGYTFQQNACSSPRLIIWSGTKNVVERAASRFWTALESKLADKGTLSPAHHMLRFIELCEYLATDDSVDPIASVSGAAARIELSSGVGWTKYAGLRFGTFTEVIVEAPELMEGLLSGEVQTLGYHGFSTDQIRAILERLRLIGVDRAVPIGQALNFDTVWDGYDLIRSLTRTIVII